MATENISILDVIGSCIKQIKENNYTADYAYLSRKNYLLAMGWKRIPRKLKKKIFNHS